MIDIYIDNKRVDTDSSVNLSISLGVTSMENIQKSKIPYSKTIKIPMTINNMEIMGDAGQINSINMFNQNEHTAKIEADGCNVLNGIPYLIEAQLDMKGNNDGGHYLICIIGSGKEWIKYAAQTTIRNIPIEFREKITPEMIANSWTWEKPIRFFPVQRDKFDVVNTEQNLFPPVKILTFEDYHPFINIRELIYNTLKKAGYSIKSRFFDSQLFKDLYMSGNYPAKNVQNIKEKMNFRAGRFQEISATADSQGKVYANPYKSFNSIGNIVDTADPKEIQNGITLENVFSNSGCFGRDDERIVFTPISELTAAFEYDITYTTDYYMLSRNELKGFNTVNLDDGQLRKYKIANRNTDRRDQLKASRNYMAIVFGHSNGDSYQFKYDEISIVNGQEIKTTKTLKIFDTRTTSVSVASQNTIDNPQVWIKRNGDTNYTLYNEDWALYDGYVKETGEITVEMNVRSSAERILPSKPKYFDLIFFGGADAGMNFKLHKTTVIKPVFAQYPSEGTTVEFNEIAAHENITALDIINSVKQMFNLIFYTDDIKKQVIIEPKDQFYTNYNPIDWTEKIDLAKPIKVYEPGGQMYKYIAFEYKTGDGAVKRWNQQNQQTFGKWIAKIENKQAKDAESSYQNTVFTASINYKGGYPDAPEASLLQAGDREKYIQNSTEELNFPPKIIMFQGLKELPQGQQWGWPANNNKYPEVYFHKQNGTTLCFENRDGAEGLNKYWKTTINKYNKAKTVEVYIDLTPQDIEPFITPFNMAKDFRTIFKLTIDREKASYRLIEIKDYNPTTRTSTKCVFLKEL